MTILCLVEVLVLATFQSTALSVHQLSFGADFAVSQYDANEGEQLVVHLSAPILTRPIPDFNGSIEVDIAAEDLPSDDTRQSALFGTDYVVNTQNTSSKVFTVTFQPKQSNSTEHVIQIAEDVIMEDSEYFRLHIQAVRFMKGAATLFRAHSSVNSFFSEVHIADYDVISFSWAVSDPFTVIEDGRTVELSAEAIGIYTRPIAVGVVCAEATETGVEPALPQRDFTITAGSKLYFQVTGQQRTLSSNKVVIQIINDNIAELPESFICTFQVQTLRYVKCIDRVRIEIHDDDGAILHWAQDIYEFAEGQQATLELVTDSVLETETIILGRPTEIPDEHPNNFPHLTVPGPGISATIQRAQFRGNIYGNAQVTHYGRTDVVNTISEFVFKPVSMSALGTFNIIDDDVLEFDELFIARFSFDPNTWYAKKGEPSTAFILIRDDDSVEVNFNEDSYTVAESDGQVSIPLRITGQFFIPVWAVIEVRDGTATDPEDYSSAMQYNVTFAQTTFFDTIEPEPFAVSSTILIDIVNDDISEGMEYFQARIVETSDRRKVRIGRGSVKVNIINNIIVDFDQVQYIVSEHNKYAVLFIKTSSLSSVAYQMTVRTQDGIANASSDYIGGSFVLDFPVGQTTVTLRIPLIDDDERCECVEDFQATLEAPDAARLLGVTAGPNNTADIKITDDELCHINFNPEQYSVAENDQDGEVTVCLLVERNCFGSFSVMLHTLNGSAKAGIDYDPGPFIVTVAPNEDTACTNIPIVDDTLFEGEQYFYIYIVVPPEVPLTPGSRANITIIDGATGIMPHDTTGLCPTEEDSVWEIHWFAIAAGSIQSARCPGEESTPEHSLAYRRCMTGMPAEWGSIDASECGSVAGKAVKKKTDDFISSLEESNGTSRDLTNKERNVFQNISQELNVILNPSDKRNRSILPQDLKTAVRFVEIVADLGVNNGLFREESNETEETVADILSKVLDERNAPAFEATAQTDSTDREGGRAATPAVSILRSTENVANVIASTLSKTKPSFTIARPNLAINSQRFSFNNLHTGIVFPGAGITLAAFRNRKSLPQIHLPRSFLHSARGIEGTFENDTIEVVNVVMNNLENYLPNHVINQDKDVEDELEQTFPASRVISSQILGYDGGEVGTKDRAEVIFPVNVKSQSLTVPPGKVKQFRCAFFNFTAEQGNQTTGGWSYRGVKTDVINTTHVRCIASHLTSFVVLASIIPSVVEPPALHYITYIGCSISLLCVLASIIFYLALSNELIQKLHNFVHLNLLIALSLGLLFFLTGIQTATANTYACKVMTALLHYFFMATFTWTLCESVLIYILLVKVLGANDRKWIYLYLALGWVLPIPVVVITGGARHDYYLIRASFDQRHPHYNSIKACWLPSENGVIFAFIGPMVAIILVNSVLLTISLVSLARSQCGRVSSRSDEKRQRYMEVGKQLLKTNIILVPLLGFTWIIGLFAVGEEGRVFAYLFVIANVFQGLFIFVLYVLRHEKVYGKIKGKLLFSKQVIAFTGSASSSAKGTHASTSDTRKVSSFALEPEATTEFRVKNKNENARSIKDGGDLDIKLNVINEEVKDKEVSDCEETHAVATVSAVAMGVLEETEEKAKGDSTEDHAGLAYAAFTTGVLSGNNTGSVIDSVC